MTDHKNTDEHILNLIQSHAIKEQSELQQLLQQRHLHVPQATLSRRLKKLNIAKVAGQYQIISHHQPHKPIVLHLEVSEFGIIVLHTHPGSASSLAFFIDQNHVSHAKGEKTTPIILGSIAGDDTVMLIVKSKQAIPHALTLLKQDFPYLIYEE